MIGAMRRNLKLIGILLWVVIAAFVGTTFLVWGKGSITGGSGATAVATVNGEEIPVDRYQRRYQEYADFYRQLYKEQFTPELAERIGLSRQVVNDLILEALVTQWADAEGLTVGDDELRSRIQSVRAFQQGGRFSPDLYRRVLKESRSEPASFEGDMRRELTQRKVEELIKSGAKVSEAELRQAYEVSNERVRAAWVFVDLSSFVAKVGATDEEIQAYLRDHPAESQRPERRRVQYVVVGSSASTQKVTDADVEAFYKEHGAEFERSRRVHAAHVLVRVPDVGGSEAEKKARAKAEDVIRRARGGEDFAKLAKEVSEDPGSAGKGGDLGFISRGEVVPAFEQVLFALKKGEIAPEPVRSPFGYHVIKVLDAQEAEKRPLKEVAAQIKEKLERERSASAALGKVDQAKGVLQAAKDFAVEARKLGLDPKEATVARGEPLAGVGKDPGVEESVFSLATGGTSNSIKTAGGYVLLRVVEHLPPAVLQFPEIREQVAPAVKRQKAEGPALERAKALAEAAGKGEDLLALAKREGFQSGDTGLITRAEVTESSRVPVEVFRQAFQTAPGRISEPIKTAQGVYLVKTLERRPPDPAGFEKERAQIEKQVLEQKQLRAWQSWLAALRSRAKIQLASQSR